MLARRHSSRPAPTWCLNLKWCLCAISRAATTPRRLTSSPNTTKSWKTAISALAQSRMQTRRKAGILLRRPRRCLVLLLPPPPMRSFLQVAAASHLEPRPAMLKWGRKRQMMQALRVLHRNARALGCRHALRYAASMHLAIPGGKQMMRWRPRLSCQWMLAKRMFRARLQAPAFNCSSAAQRCLMVSWQVVQIQKVPHGRGRKPSQTCLNSCSRWASVNRVFGAT
mmetsp:Transcript_79791/g.239041  ORF Transcript_79791/g.239041 Transcript_79791/m.239041 type:complete len:225 (+) Transcript_79791:121-795(+)